MPGMTTRERMLAVYRNQLPDRLPVAIYDRYLPRGGSERELRNLGLGVIDYYPATSLLAPPWHLNPGYLSEVEGAELEVRFGWENNELVETRGYETPVGRISQRSRKDPAFGSDWIIKYYLETPEDYRVMLYLVEHTVLRRNDKALQARISNLGEDGVVLARLDRSPYQKLLLELAGPERFLVDLHVQPDFALELMAALERRMDEAFEMMLDTEAQVVWQPDNLTSDTAPPGHFERYCLPFYKKRGLSCRAMAKTYMVHCDGRLRALKDLIGQCPIDGIESFSLPEIGGDMTIGDARAAWPDKTILPNFPSSLCYADEAQIDGFLGQLLSAGAGMPFMLQISEDIPPAEWTRVVPQICRSFQSMQQAKSAGA